MQLTCQKDVGMGLYVKLIAICYHYTLFACLLALLSLLLFTFLAWKSSFSYRHLTFIFSFRSVANQLDFQFRTSLVEEEEEFSQFGYLLVFYLSEALFSNFGSQAGYRKSEDKFRYH